MDKSIENAIGLLIDVALTAQALANENHGSWVVCFPAHHHEPLTHNRHHGYTRGIGSVVLFRTQETAEAAAKRWGGRPPDLSSAMRITDWAAQRAKAIYQITSEIKRLNS